LGKGGIIMAHHYKSSCKQCYRYDICIKEENTHLKEERIEHAKNNGRVFAYHVPSERKAYIKKWNEMGTPIGMHNHDCFKSPEERKRDLENQKKSKR
jgi:hypothetical protein